MSLYVETPEAKIVLPHKYQVLILLTKAKEIAVVTGQGSGKSSFAPVWLAKKMIDNGVGEYAITEPTYSMVERVATKYFLDFVRGTELEGDWISKKHGIYGTEFGNVHFYSTENPEHIQGAHFKAVVMDEAGQSPRLAYTTIRGRLNLYDGQLLMLSNPYIKKDAWLFIDLKKRFDDGDPDVLYITFPSIENPSFDRRVFERDRKILTPEEFAFQYLGVYTKPEGLIYDYDRNAVVKDIKYNGETCFAGMDWGFADPTVLEIGFVNSTGLHIIDEYYKQDVDPAGHIKEFAKLIKKYNIQTIFYDPSAISQVSVIQKGLKEMEISVRFEKANNAINDGIQETTRLFRTERLTISPKCYHLLDEDMAYRWKNGNPYGDDHCNDARRYLVMGVSKMSHHETYKAPNVEKKILDKTQEYYHQLLESIFGKKEKPIDWREIF